MLTSAGSTASSFPMKTFEAQSLQLTLTAYCFDRPVLIIFGITSADPEFSFQRLACLTGAGLAPAGIYDLA